MGKSIHELKDDINYAACDLRKAEEKMAELHQEAADALVVAALARADDRWNMADDNELDLQVTISGRLFKALLEAQSDVGVERNHLNKLRLELADALEREAADLRRQAN